jgi:aldose 1-epimerase
MTSAAFTTVALRDESASLEATFAPAVGMLCCSLRHRGEELLTQNAGVVAYAERGKTMGIPLLYPWANRLAGFEYNLAGRTVAVPRDPSRVALDGGGLPIHGVVGGRLEWELESAPTPGAPSLVACLSWDESKPELFEVFPFRHDLRYEARLAEGRLELEVTLHACADAVPVAFGFHPYLSPPGVPRERWQVELPPMRQLALDDRQIPVGPEQMLPRRRLQLGESDFDDGFDMVAEPARFEVLAARRRIALELVEGYPCAQVYAPRGRELICFEPMTAPANALRSGTGLRVLAPGERYRARFVVHIEDSFSTATPRHE